jgi:type II secretory pathway component PulC
VRGNVLKDADVKKKIELTVTGIGVVIFIFLIISYAQKSGHKKIISKINAYPASTMAMTGSLESKESWDKIKWGKDPFLMDASSLKGHQGMAGLVLNGIVSDRENPYAIINNDVVKLGDKVNDMTVIEINEKSVILEQDGQKHTLELNTY